eukprot:637720-Hanusia_phi.AAC.1
MLWESEDLDLVRSVLWKHGGQHCEEYEQIRFLHLQDDLQQSSASKREWTSQRAIHATRHPDDVDDVPSMCKEDDKLKVVKLQQDDASTLNVRAINEIFESYQKVSAWKLETLITTRYNICRHSSVCDWTSNTSQALSSKLSYHGLKKSSHTWTGFYTQARRFALMCTSNGMLCWQSEPSLNGKQDDTGASP